MKPFGFPKSVRLRTTADYARVYDLKQRAGDDHLLIFAANGACTWTRAGISVSKKHGNAVRRSRLKRVLREAFRLTRHELPPGLDLILIPRQDTASTLDDYRRSVQSISRRLARRLTKSTDSGAER